ncbi:uncharacterized protein C8orf76 homolog [Ochotona curzoniae]|uniref:uncharacterized protein C8orf76 homolog n=1 Tax=Ochotona curzoniae TaxID=130825 RepID=UPI001B34A8DA|nr:uncharacterized protein C8orf76 homolog [Ochotona curzoniae]
MESGCWLFGGEFEDSVFEERPERRLGPPAPYRAKRCEPQWFCEETASSDDVEALSTKKFRGDLAYRRQEYEAALQEYSSIAEKLSLTNFAMQRDVREGQARCLARLGRHEEALAVATCLEKKATNTDHLTTVLYLQFAIFSSWQDVERTVFCLQKLISLHPFNPWNWGRLAEAYLRLGLALTTSFASSQKQNSFTSGAEMVSSPSPHSGRGGLSCSPETLPGTSALAEEAGSSHSQEEEPATGDVPHCVAEKREAALRDTQMKACASFIRTRLLLQLTQSQQTSFALEKNLRTQREIEDRMKGFSFKEDTLLVIAEVMGEDIVPEKIKEELHSEVKSVGPAALTAWEAASCEEFEARWFHRIREQLWPCRSQLSVHTHTSA